MATGQSQAGVVLGRLGLTLRAGHPSLREPFPTTHTSDPTVDSLKTAGRFADSRPCGLRGVDTVKVEVVAW